MLGVSLISPAGITVTMETVDSEIELKTIYFLKKCFSKSTVARQHLPQKGRG